MHERPSTQPGMKPAEMGFSSAKFARTGRYWVPQGPATDPKSDWDVTFTGDFVRIPVYAYRTKHHALAAILACGLDVAFSSMEGLSANAPGAIIEEIILVLGDKCTDLGEAFRVYVGFAFRVQERST